MRKAKTTLRAVLTLVIAVVAASAMAFEQDMPSGAKFYPEQGQGQLSQQQSMTGRINVVGQVDAESATTKSAPMSGEASTTSFASAEQTKANQTFGQAATQIKSGRTPVSWFFVALMLLGLVVLAVVGVKYYTDKVVPLPKRLQS